MVQAEQQDQQQLQPHTALLEQSKLASRLNTLPAVNQSLNLIFNVYGRTKEKNDLIRRALEMGEATLLSSILLANDAADKSGLKNIVEKPARYVDESAANVVDVVEKRIPQINLTPQELLDNTKEWVSTTRDTVMQATSDRVSNIKTMVGDAAGYGVSTLNNIISITALQDKVNWGLEACDHYVDCYFPEEGDDKQELVAEQQKADAGIKKETLELARNLGGKLGHRLLVRLGNLAQQGKSSVVVVMPNWRDSQFLKSLQSMLSEVGARIRPLANEENLPPRVQKTLKPIREGLSATGAMILSVVPEKAAENVTDMSKRLYETVSNVHILGGGIPEASELMPTTNDGVDAPVAETGQLEQQKQQRKRQAKNKAKQLEKQKVEESDAYYSPNASFSSMPQ